MCKEHSKALRLFLQCGERAVDQAIEVVGRARSDMLTHQLIDFLMGETDGVPKDPNYIFRLYMALGNYPQAAKTAIIIARQEQELGNYRIAHGILFETHRELTAQRIRVPQVAAASARPAAGPTVAAGPHRLACSLPAALPAPRHPSSRAAAHAAPLSWRCHPTPPRRNSPST